MSAPVPRAPRARTGAATDVRALVATAIGQGGSRDDEFDCIAGELVWVPSRCREPGCTCAIVFLGATSSARTTTAEVVALRIPRARLAQALAGSMCSHCYPGGRAAVEAERLLRTAERLPLGAVVERDGAGGIRPRLMARR